MRKIAKTRYAHPTRKVGEMVVQNGLAVTPKQVMEMAKQGIPANGLNAQMFTEGHTGSDWNLAIDEQRGVDVATIWQHTKDLQLKFRKAHDANPPKSE